MLLASLLIFSSTGYAENIDPADKFAWSETAGWINFVEVTIDPN